MISLLSKNKNRFVYSSEYFNIIVGRNQKANDELIDEYKLKNNNCYWFHVYNDSSAHIILEAKEYVPLTLYMDASLYIKNHIFKPKTRDNQKSIIMITRLSDITKTSTLGLVITKNEYLMNTDSWYKIFVK